MADVVVLFDENGSAEAADRPGSLDRVPEDKLLWIDLDDPNGAADAELDVEADADLLKRLGESATRPSVTAGESSILVTVSIPDGDDAGRFTQVRCLLGRNWVVTAHEERSDVLERFREHAQGAGEVGRLDGPSFLATLLEWVLEAYRNGFEAIESELDEFDLRALDGRLGDADDEVRGLVRLRSRVGCLRRELVDHRPVVTALGHSELDALSTEESAARFAAVRERLEETVQAARDSRDAVVGSFDVIIARSEHRTNQTMKVLALVTVIFLPGTFLAGLMGVNFKVGFFSNGSYFWVLVGAIAAAALATLVVARLRRWI